MDLRDGLYLVGKKLSIELVDAFRLPDELETLREKAWIELITTHPSSFDGELLGLSALEVTDDEVRFSCRKTTYSSYVVTRESDFTERYPGVARADPIGVTVILLSRDEKVLVSTRSESAEQNPGALYFVGGYASSRDKPEDICFFEDAKREVFEETAVSVDDDAKALLLGVSYDPVFCHPEITMLLPCNETFGEMELKFSSAADRSETKGFYGVPVVDLLKDQWPRAIKDRKKTLSVVTSLSFFTRWKSESSSKK